jgi:hypothetical protein
MMPNQDEELRRLLKLMQVTLKNADKRLRVKLIFSFITMIISMSIFLIAIFGLVEQSVNFNRRSLLLYITMLVISILMISFCIIINLRHERSSIFSVAVAKFTSIRKLLTSLGCVFIILGVLVFTNEIAWPLVILSLFPTIDLVLILIRLYNANYGTNDIELREATRYIVEQQRSGGGPGKFDRVFLARETPTAPRTGPTAPEGAH